MHAPVQSARGEPAERYQATRRVTLVGLVVNLLLGIGKILIGIAAHSQSLVADGIHSLSDLATDVMVIFAAKHAHREADEEHPYGHGRIETVMTVALGAVLVLVAIGIAWDAAHRLFNPEELLVPGMLALVGALVSVLAKEALYHYTMVVARRLRSKMLRANAWHHRSDAISSIVVMIGVAGTMAGLPYLDAIAAVIVGFMVAKIGWDLAWRSLQELIDTALDEEELQRIRDAIRDVKGVRALHMLRSRMSGGDALVDVHIQVDPTLSVSEGHQIGEKVRQTLINDIDSVADVTVHIDPEDDETRPSCDHLPLRHELVEKLRALWADDPVAGQIRDITLHYLDGKVHVDLVLPLELAGDRAAAEVLRARLEARARQLDGFGDLRVLFE